MKKTVFKPVGIGAAAGALAAAFFGQRHAAVRLIFAMMLLNLVSLGAAEALRRTVGRLTARRQVRANAWIAAGMTVAGTAILLAIAPLLTAWYDFIERVFPVYAWSADELNWWILAAGGFALARIMTVVFDASGDRTSANLTEMLCFAAAAGSLAMFRNTAYAPKACAAAAGGVMLIAALVGLLLKQPGQAFKVPAKPFSLLKDVPAALGRVILFPALVCCVHFVCERVPMSLAMAKLVPDGMSVPVLAGFALTELLRTDWRRDERESAPLSAWLTLGAAIMALGVAVYIWLLPPTSGPIDFTLSKRWIALKAAAVLLASSGGVMALYAERSWRTAVTAVLMIGTALTAPAMIGTAGGLSLFTVQIASAATALGAIVAALTAFPDWSMLHRQHRAAKIRKRAQKMRG